MIQTFGQILPLAVCIALSTVPLLVTLTLLLGPRTTASSVTFVVGWVIGMFGVLVLLFAGAAVIPESSLDLSGPLLGWAEMVIGIALIAWAVVSFVRRRQVHPATDTSRFLTAIGSVRPIPAFGLAFVLCLRPKSLLVSSAASLAVASSELPLAAALVELVLFVVIGASAVVVPVIVTLARPEEMRHPLEATKRWISDNSRSITLVAALLTGIFVLGHGMTQL